MTFAHLSAATASSQRVFHESQNTFNRIQNSFITNEIHDQGKFSQITILVWTFLKLYSADSSFCWAFSLSTMIRHSLNYFLAQLAKEQPARFEQDVLVEAIQFLNSLDFHKRLRIGCQDYLLWLFSRSSGGQKANYEIW